MPFEFQRLELSDVVLIRPKIFVDKRGYFLELFKSSSFEVGGLRLNLCQLNLSYSEKGVLRGLHYQRHPFAQGKLVCCLEGEIFDVAVDIRVRSPSFRKHIGVILNGKEKNMLWIPEGFAHGFVVLSDYALVIYGVTGAEYSPEHDAGIIWNDPDLAIPWPINNPVLSEKDLNLPTLREIPFENLL